MAFFSDIHTSSQTEIHMNDYRTTALIGLLTASTLLSTPVVAGLVDLSTWTAEGNGNWTLGGGNNSAFQSINGTPTVFYSDFLGQGVALSGNITVEATGDDDYIGFVLGFQPGDIASAATDFIVVDWKQATQVFFGCTGQAGLAISRFSAGAPDNADSWCHQGSVNELARGTTLGSTGWVDNTTYSFDLVFNPTNIQVFVDGTKELDINGSFANGRFGFYNYSQESVRYSAIQQDPTSAPIPSVLLLMLGGIGGIVYTRRRRTDYMLSRKSARTVL